jgi:hypothetical protein
MYNRTSSNNTEKAPYTALAVAGGVVALLAVLALLGAFCVAFCTFPAVLPLWSLWIAGGVALAVVGGIGVKAVFVD